VQQAGGVAADDDVGADRADGPQLLVGHRHRGLGELDAEGAAEAAAAVGPRPLDQLAPLDQAEQLGGLVGDVELAQQVAALVERDPLGVPQPQLGEGRGPLGEQLGELAGALADPAGPLRGLEVADDLEQLGPEDPHHRGARSGGHDHEVGAAAQLGLEGGERGAGHRGRLVGEPGVPRGLAATGLGEVARHRAAAGPQEPHRRFPDLGGDDVDHARDQQADACGSELVLV
jgi:hypothetical protein